MADFIYSLPRPSYFVTFTGTLVPASSNNPTFAIPNLHRREGDVDDNPLLRVIIQNYVNGSTGVIQVQDETGAVCLNLTTNGDRETIITDTKLKINGLFGLGTVGYHIMAFYAKPIGR